MSFKVRKIIPPAQIHRIYELGSDKPVELIKGRADPEYTEIEFDRLLITKFKYINMWLVSVLNQPQFESIEYKSLNDLLDDDFIPNTIKEEIIFNLDLFSTL